MAYNGIPTYTLNSGYKIPLIGLGTFKSQNQTEVIRNAIKAGYRYFDCAEKYQNQKEIGIAFKTIFNEGLIKREEIFVTSKVDAHHHSARDVDVAIKATLFDLQLTYLDLYLIHWPISYDPQVPLHVTWEAMEKMKDEGYTKSIGVCNFNVQLLHDLLTYARIKPACNQIEINPFLQQPDLIQYCHKQGILCTGYCPLARPSGPSVQEFTNITYNPFIVEMAKKYGKVPSQIVLRWGLQRKTKDYLTGEPIALTNVNLIPKASSIGHLQENIDVFNFTLEESDMEKFAELERGIRLADGVEPYNIPIFV